MMLPSELLEQGWCQNMLWDDRGGVCLAGAAIQGQGKFEEFSMIAHQLLSSRLDFDGNIANWNNQPERTQGEVIALARLVEIKLGLRPLETDGEVATLEGIPA